MSTTKKFWTYGEIVGKVRQDLDLQEETFITVSEMLGYLNEAIDHCETLVNTLYKDYFLGRPYTFSLVSGTDGYAMPPRIYADAIRRVILRLGSQVYTVQRERDWHKFETYTIDRVSSTATLYSYFLTNDGPGDVQLLMTPVPQETSFIDVWYIRQANRIVLDALDNPIIFANYTYGGLIFTAINGGYKGDLVTLTFDGVADADAVIAVWNAANPTNAVTHDGVGTEVLPATTFSLENGGSDIIDIPEAHNYIMSFMKLQCTIKESNGLMTKAIEVRMIEVQDRKDQLEGSLAAREPDAQNTIELDYTSYQEMS